MDEKNAVATGGTRHDGYMNVLNRFGTAQDNGEAYHFAPETMVDDMTLAAHYEGNGLFTKIIDIPAEKAATREFDLGLSDEDVKSLVTDALEDLDWVTTTAQAVKWSRLFGGAIAVMLIDDGGRLEDPLNWNTIKGIDEIALFERAVVEPDYSYLYNYGRPQGTKQFRPKFGKPQFFRVYSQYGHFVVHESRCLTFRNGILPETTTQAEYRFWGVPEYARIKRALRETVTNHANGTKLLERSVQGIYKMNGLTSTLSVEGGDEEVLRRLKTIDMARGILNSIVIDGDGEEYTFQTFQLSGFSEAINASCNMLSAVTNIPQTILFGRSPAGENSTGEADLENWYNYLGQISDLQVKGNLQRLLDILFRGWLNTKQLHEEPKYKLEFKPFWNLSEMEQADLDQKKANTEHIKAQTAQIYVGLQSLDPSEVRGALADSGEFQVEDILDGIPPEELLLEPQEDPMAGLEADPPTTPIFEQGSFPPAPKANQDASDDQPKTTGKGVGVLVVRDGKILTGLRRTEGTFCGPGGHIEDGETPEQAALRETQEEFGITPTELIHIGSTSGVAKPYLPSEIYLCTEYNGAPKADGNEMAFAQFMEPAKVLSLIDAGVAFPPFAESVKLLTSSIS
ncbi:anti-CBASS protein Acb1 family protein [uncultured Oscillibacter sp.]|uniref:phage portal protein n=1 Tax=uncultured Oscillibacter sp. TaxID=876091 RepID=UPI002729E0C5|nr:anti-CBASS Acb1 family protein [uncultured Oscillibacter sp.]